MARIKFKLVKSNCKRCGSEIVTGNRSLHGAEDLKVELGGICSRCITPEEESRILMGQAAAIIERPANA